MVISRAIENRLATHGFDTFDRAWATDQAVGLAAHHRPDLVVVGDTIAEGSPVDVAREIAGSCASPVLMVRSGRVTLERYLPSRTQVQGPFHIVQLDTALASLGERCQQLQLLA